MKKLALILVVAAVSACGVDGEPTPPEVTGKTTVGVNSDSGLFNSTQITLLFGGN